MHHDKFELLRQQAEEMMSQAAPQQQVAKDFVELAHELQVHQIELDLQNEELRETQTRLEEIKNNYFELYEFAPVGYMNMDERGMIGTVNLQAVKLFDIPRSNLLGRAFGSFVDPAFQNIFFTHLRGVLADPQSLSCELALLRPDHTPFFVKMESSYAGQNSSGKKVIRSVIIDITELNRTRREIDSLNRELEKKVAERTATAELRLNQLKQLNFELIRAEHRERRRLAELLHDNLQQLLVGCQFNLSILRKRPGETESADVLKRTGRILKDAIAVSRSLSYELFPPVLYEGGLSAAFDWLRSQKMTLHNFNVHLNIDQNLPRLPVDIEAFFFQCAKELLLNSLKHAKTTAADLTLRYSDGRLTLCVADKGQGCAPDDLKIGPARKKGFGLFNIKNRIETMSGTFAAESTTEGFSITVTLPVSSLLEELQAAAEKPKTPITGTPLPIRGRAINVMLVDDDRTYRKTIRHLLEMQADIAVIAEAKDGLQAIKKARLRTPDVILMDIGLPGKNGIEATATITRENRRVQVIALSQHESEEMVNKMLAAGANLYLTKNIPAEELLLAIRTAASNTAATRPPRR